MHYYKRNIGDYSKKAGRLTMLQHGAYTLLLDACYDREIFPTREEALDWTWASTPEEIAAVDFVLGKFFTLEEKRYVQNRIRDELAGFHAIATTNQRIATERERKRKASSTNRDLEANEPSTKREPSVNEAPPNHKPLTINQEPLTTNQEPNTQTHFATLPTAAGAVCVALRSEGMNSVNPSNQKLLELLENGAEIQDFVSAWRGCRDKGKGFSYVLAIVDGQRKSMQDLANHALKLPAFKASKHSGFDQIDYKEGVNADGTIQ
jgi:uncharacterized protein YdaU (DUF1376 family)